MKIIYTYSPIFASFFVPFLLFSMDIFDQKKLAIHNACGRAIILSYACVSNQVITKKIYSQEQPEPSVIITPSTGYLTIEIKGFEKTHKVVKLSSSIVFRHNEKKDEIEIVQDKEVIACIEKNDISNKPKKR